MKKFVCLIILFLMISLTISAQASGGQITRKKANTATTTAAPKKPNSISKTNTPSKSRSSGQTSRSSGTAPKAIDLGLPSGTLWADRNIGAKSPEGYGSLFAWGETVTKRRFDSGNYKWGYPKFSKYCTSLDDGTVDDKIELDLEDDAAYVNWGHNWRMPTYAQFDELVNGKYTEVKWGKFKNSYGLTITSKINGNTIFLPASDLRPDGFGKNGQYWCRTLSISGNAYNLSFYEQSGVGVSVYPYFDRYSGHCIRPVYSDSTTDRIIQAQKDRIIQNLINNMVYVEGGTFMMGATSEQGDAFNTGKPVHQVTLSSFSIGRYEVTREEWQAVMMDSSPSKLPMTSVSWEDCQLFILRWIYKNHLLYVFLLLNIKKSNCVNPYQISKLYLLLDYSTGLIKYFLNEQQMDL